MIPRPVEVSLYKTLKPLGSQKYLLSVSGGADSMAMLYAFAAIAQRLPMELTVASIHHGVSEGAQGKYRDRAIALVRKACAELKIPFLTNVPSKRELTSEAEFRKLRKALLDDFKKQSGSDFIVFAHHREDLLETRLLRLIRGTGPQGLKSMQIRKGFLLRPFLALEKQQLLDYLRQQKSRFVEDPSNSETQFMRNWLRREWLPALEARQRGALHRMAESLNSLVVAIETAPAIDFCYEDKRILRQEFIGLTDIDKRRALGLYLKREGFENYGLSHINELIKRLDVEQKDLNFRMLKKSWLANARHIWCE